MVVTKQISRQSKGNTDIIDITGEVARHVAESGANDGIVTIFVTGSTAGVTTIEHEPGLLADFKAMWERVIPKNLPYDHDRAWGEGNGFSHVRASLLGASRVVPISGGRMVLGTWQQIALVDFDHRPRSRQVVVQVMGE
jgi:secondary thiamine-phosphate synthase enzyme